MLQVSGGPDEPAGDSPAPSEEEFEALYQARLDKPATKRELLSVFERLYIQQMQISLAIVALIHDEKEVAGKALEKAYDSSSETTRFMRELAGLPQK